MPKPSATRDRILKLRAKGKTLSEIAGIVGVGERWVRRVLAKARRDYAVLERNAS